MDSDARGMGYSAGFWTVHVDEVGRIVMTIESDVDLSTDLESCGMDTVDDDRIFCGGGGGVCVVVVGTLS